MVTDEEVLAFFRKKLPEQATLLFRPVPLQMDDVLQAYCDADDVIYAINDALERFNIDAADLNLDDYYPWRAEWFFRKWFTKKPISQLSKPLSVRMFAESAKAGRWLYV